LITGHRLLVIAKMVAPPPVSLERLIAWSLASLRLQRCSCTRLATDLAPQRILKTQRPRPHSAKSAYPPRPADNSSPDRAQDGYQPLPIVPAPGWPPNICPPECKPTPG